MNGVKTNKNTRLANDNLSIKGHRKSNSINFQPKDFIIPSSYKQSYQMKKKELTTHYSKIKPENTKKQTDTKEKKHLKSNPIVNCEDELKEKEIEEHEFYEENDQKLKDAFHAYATQIRRNEGGGVNTLFKIRTILLNWLKDNEQDNLEYSKFMTEKKIKYLLKNKEKLETRIKLLTNELTVLQTRKGELENILGEVYAHYETQELKEEVDRFGKSYEIKSGRSKKMLEIYEQMQKMLPYVEEYNKLKEQELAKLNEKKEKENINKSSSQTLGLLSNYYKNIRQKISEAV